jgi:flagellar motor switch protein FliM
MTPPHDTARHAAREAQAQLDDAEAYDEDYGLDDENDGDDEEYADEQGYGEQEGYGEEGAYEEEPDPPGDDNLEQVEALLGDIPMVLMVELGRVQLTADEIIRLRPGQLIELGRAPTDPVDLVVGGKLVAKGELVEIDGALGVKLLNLAKGAE